MENDQPINMPKNFVLWVGELYLGKKIAEEQEDLAKQEVVKLSAKLSKCRCKDAEDAG